MTSKKLSIENLTFQATKIDVSNHILTITLNRPEKKNALNNVMMNEINYALAYAKQERGIRVVIIAAEGDVFCAGADLNRKQEESNVPRLEGSDDISLSIRHLYKPVICKIQGSVHAGALLMVTNCTHAIAVESAKFSAPEILRGVWPHMVMAGLFRVMPKRVGLDFIMRGNAIDANQALTHGLINQHFVKEDFQIEVDKIISELASMPPNAMKKGLSAFHKQEFDDFEDAMNFLESEINDSLKSDEAIEGITAFLEKRKPNWK